MPSSTRIDPAERAVVTDVARAVLAQASPQELPLLRLTSEAYFADPDAALKKTRGSEEMIGFGGEYAVALAPIVLAMVSEAVRYILREVGKSVVSQGASAAGDYVKRLFHPAHDGGADGAGGVTPLTSLQLAEVRKRAYEKARQLDVGEAQAQLLADSLVGTLLPAS